MVIFGVIWARTTDDRPRFQPCKNQDSCVWIKEKRVIFEAISLLALLLFSKNVEWEFKLRVLIGAASLMCGFTPPRSTSIHSYCFLVLLQFLTIKLTRQIYDKLPKFPENGNARKSRKIPRFKISGICRKCRKCRKFRKMTEIPEIP